MVERKYPKTQNWLHEKKDGRQHAVIIIALFKEYLVLLGQTTSFSKIVFLSDLNDKPAKFLDCIFHDCDTITLMKLFIDQKQHTKY